jgi:divalent metal cation (Fe/Co/Zn/Cd) transporter
MAEETTDQAEATPEQSVAAIETHEEAHGHGEEIHMPPNSYWPLVTAVGVAATLVGLIPILETPVAFIIGLLILLAGIGGWVRDARKEYKELH